MKQSIQLTEYIVASCVCGGFLINIFLAALAPEWDQEIHVKETERNRVGCAPEPSRRCRLELNYPQVTTSSKIACLRSTSG